MPTRAKDSLRETGPVHDIDFAAADFQRDPWPTYDWYRENDPVSLSRRYGAYFVFGYEHVRRVMTSPDFTAFHPFRVSRRAFGPTMLDQDGEHHTRLRSAAADPFRPRAATEFGRRVVAPLAGRMLDDLLTRGHRDFVTRLAEQLPMAVVCHVMGLPDGDAGRLRELMRPLVEYVDHGTVSLEQVVAARGELRSYLRAALSARPGADGLLNALAENGTLDEADVVNTSVLLLAAGTETTAAGITNVLSRVAAEPEVFHRLREDRSLVRAVVTETLRHEPPLHVTLRFAARDVTLGGVDIPVGTPLQVVLASANRDPAVYPSPHVWDPERTIRTPFTFGMGRHVCLGMGLAQQELEIVLHGVLDRVGELGLRGGPLAPAQGRTFRTVRDFECVYRLRSGDDAVRTT
ncbi:cytochrome P450 [Streptomyces sp. NPDC047042]|uniref:cytochrome P450 n=1 Tax=Streptomyces sp. NPDC047042 TaxID=3154807 RepID=UPI0033FF92CF